MEIDPPPIVRIEGLRMRFGSHEVLRGIDLLVPAGRILGYLGPNGAGKSTTVKILIGMLSGFHGSVTVCGFDVVKDPLEVKRRVGYVPEAGALYEALTPLEYLSLVGGLYGLTEKELTEKACELLQLFGLRDQREDRMTTFSKGMKQKVLIIAGLIHNPELVFLDEPMSGLDANATVLVKELITGLAKAGKTVFYCSHLMDVVERICDRITIIDGGRIVADGTFQELKSKVQDASLERIFTQLTRKAGEDGVAADFLRVIQG
jgi:ABC-2 type transport system ATP-binding protein